MKKLGALALLGLTLGAEKTVVGAIVYDVPAGNTTQPNNSPIWNSVGLWDGAGGVVIAPNYFLSAQHVGSLNPGGTFSLTTTISGVTSTTNYITTQSDPIPNTDLVVWQVNGTFPSQSIMPLYTGTAASEVGLPVSFVGYGLHTQGTPINVTGLVPNGWYWTGGQAKNSSTNTVTSVMNDGVHNSEALDYVFGPGDDGIYAAGDSGGGAFIDNGGQYQLAGIAYGVQEFFTETSPGVYTPLADGNNGGAFDAAIYNGTGLYVQNDMLDFIPATTAGQGGQASSVVAYENQIMSFVPEPGSAALGLGGAVLLLRRPRSL